MGQKKGSFNRGRTIAHITSEANSRQRSWFANAHISLHFQLSFSLSLTVKFYSTELTGAVFFNCS